MGLTLETSKTELMHFSRYQIEKKGKCFWRGTFPDMDLGVPPFTGPNKLRPKAIWRYLGFFFDPYLSFQSHVDMYINKAYSTIRAYRMFGNSLGGLDPLNHRLVFNACVWPILTYGFQVYWKPQGTGIKAMARRMSAVQHYATRWITGAFKTTPGNATDLIGGLPPLPVRLTAALKGAVLRWQNLPTSHPIRLLENAPLPHFLEKALIR
jgi:hypothetical protein